MSENTNDKYKSTIKELFLHLFNNTSPSDSTLNTSSQQYIYIDMLLSANTSISSFQTWLLNNRSSHSEDSPFRIWYGIESTVSTKFDFEPSKSTFEISKNNMDVIYNILTLSNRNPENILYLIKAKCHLINYVLFLTTERATKNNIPLNVYVIGIMFKLLSQCIEDVKYGITYNINIKNNDLFYPDLLISYILFIYFSIINNNKTWEIRLTSDDEFYKCCTYHVEEYDSVKDDLSAIARLDNIYDWPYQMILENCEHLTIIIDNTNQLTTLTSFIKKYFLNDSTVFTKLNITAPFNMYKTLPVLSFRTKYLSIRFTSTPSTSFEVKLLPIDKTSTVSHLSITGDRIKINSLPNNAVDSWKTFSFISWNNDYAISTEKIFPCFDIPLTMMIKSMSTIRSLTWCDITMNSFYEYFIMNNNNAFKEIKEINLSIIKGTINEISINFTWKGISDFLRNPLFKNWESLKWCFKAFDFRINEYNSYYLLDLGLNNFDKWSVFSIVFLSDLFKRKCMKTIYEKDKIEDFGVEKVKTDLELSTFWIVNEANNWGKMKKIYENSTFDLLVAIIVTSKNLDINYIGKLKRNPILTTLLTFLRVEKTRYYSVSNCHYDSK